MKQRDVITGVELAYICHFQPEPEGGYTVTCPSLPPVVTYGETLDEARLFVWRERRRGRDIETSLGPCVRRVRMLTTGTARGGERPADLRHRNRPTSIDPEELTAGGDIIHRPTRVVPQLAKTR